MKQKIKLGIILGVEFIAITVILILIFFSGKKTYTVKFDLNGGTLISGELVQTVSQGKSATAPTVAKDGCYLHSWSTSFKNVTKDIVVKAVWEWEDKVATGNEISIGFEYTSAENMDYCEIVKAYEYLYGDVYVSAHRDNKIILGIQGAKLSKNEQGEDVRVGAFYNLDLITNIYMLDGMIYIGDYAFAECDNLESVELPGTLKVLGEGAFMNCTSLERVVFPDDLEVIPAYAFAGCTSLKEIVIPASVKKIDQSAFVGCTALESIVFETDEIEDPAYADAVDKSDSDDKTDKKSEKEENNENEQIPLIKIGLVELGDCVFSGCTSLTEITLPQTIEIVTEDTFVGVEMTVNVYFAEDEVPEGFAPGWDSHVTVVWEYVPSPSDGEDDSASDE
jgi:hypothetical protein